MHLRVSITMIHERSSTGFAIALTSSRCIRSRTSSFGSLVTLFRTVKYLRVTSPAGSADWALAVRAAVKPVPATATALPTKAPVRITSRREMLPVTSVLGRFIVFLSLSCWSCENTVIREFNRNKIGRQGTTRVPSLINL